VSNGEQRRSSIFKGLLLILLGVLLLMYRFHEFRIGHLIWRYWPVLIILWGVAKLIDNFTARRTGEGRPPFLTGGEVALVLLFVFVLGAVGFKEWVRNKYPDVDIELSPFNTRYSKSQELAPMALPAGSHVTINTGRGNITVHASGGNDLRVSVNESVAASREASAQDRMKNVPVVMEETADGYSVHPVNQEDSEGQVTVDLDVQVPKETSLTVKATRGDINLSGITGSVSAGTNNGDIEIHDVGSDVSADLQKGDAHIRGVAGDVRVTGQANEIEVADVAGDVTLSGNFFGPIRLRNVAKTTHYTSQRSDLTVVHMTGRMVLDAGQIEISDVAGFAELATRDKNIEVEDVAGRLDVSDSHGDINVRFSSPPREEVNLTNDSGEVDVTLPSRSSFEISAVSRSGEVQSDFEGSSIKTGNNEDTGRLSGKIGEHGPKITINTSYGTIYLHKSS
jgi:DUF4097 and DUF4098 domain-containing protein YvlB